MRNEIDIYIGNPGKEYIDRFYDNDGLYLTWHYKSNLRYELKLVKYDNSNYKVFSNDKLIKSFNSFYKAEDFIRENINSLGFRIEKLTRKQQDNSI